MRLARRQWMWLAVVVLVLVVLVIAGIALDHYLPDDFGHRPAN